MFHKFRLNRIFFGDYEIEFSTWSDQFSSPLPITTDFRSLVECFESWHEKEQFELDCGNWPGDGSVRLT